MSLRMRDQLKRIPAHLIKYATPPLSPMRQDENQEEERISILQDVLPNKEMPKVSHTDFTPPESEKEIERGMRSVSPDMYQL